MGYGNEPRPDNGLSPFLRINDGFVQFDSVYSVNSAIPGEKSHLVAEFQGREVGILTCHADAPNVDKRYFGAAKARQRKKLSYNTFLALIGSDIDIAEESLFCYGRAIQLPFSDTISY